MLWRFLYEKNYVGYREYVKFFLFFFIDKSRLFEFFELWGGIEVCGCVEEIVDFV